MEFDYDFFISFSGDDRPLAEAIYAALAEREIGRPPYKVCFQATDFHLGHSFTERMEHGLTRSRVTLVVLTPNYLATSLYTRAEFDAAWQAGRLLIFQFDGAAVPVYAGTVVYQPFDIKPGQAGFTDLVRRAATLTPTPVGAKDCRIRLLDNMPKWKGGGSGLVGREAELDELTTAWQADACSVVCVIADGGYGKSSLVNHWLGQLRDKGGRTKYLGVQAGFSYSFYRQGWETRAGASTGAFFRECAAFLRGVTPESLDRETKDTMALANQVLDVVRQRRTLLVLDGLEPHQVPRGTEREGSVVDGPLRTLIHGMLDHPGGGLCVVTSRVMPAELQPFVADGRVRKIELTALAAEPARRVLVAAGLPAEHPDLPYWAERSGGHPLLLALLAPAIRDGRYTRDTFESHRVVTDNGQAKFDETVANFVRSHLNELGPEAAAVLYSTCLFGKPISYGQLRDQLLDRADIPFVTAPLRTRSGLRRGVSEQAFTNGLDLLRRAAMLTLSDPDTPAFEPHGDALGPSSQLEAHPLIQAGTRVQLEAEHRPALRRANWVIYRSMCKSVAQWRPDEPEQLRKLYEAVPHGVAAGRGKTAGWMYAMRCLRGFRAYSTNQKGMIGDDVALMSHYFRGNWKTLREDVGLNTYAKIQACVWSGVLLAGVNRAADGRKLMEKGLAEAIKTRNFTAAGRTARLLASSLLLSGEFARAEKYCRQSSELLVQSRPLHVRLLERRLVDMPFQRMSSLATLGSALHYVGRFADADAAFAAATAEQKAHVPFEHLRGIWCFRHVEMLLDAGRLDEADALVESGGVDHERPEGWSEGVFALPLIELSLLRARIRRADLTGERRDWPRVIGLANQLRKFGGDGQTLRMDWLIPAFAVAVAGVARLCDDPDAAATPLRDAQKQVDLSGNRLFAADVRLEHARLALSTGRPVDAAARVAEAARLAHDLGYACKNAELARLSALIGTTPPAAVWPGIGPATTTPPGVLHA